MLQGFAPPASPQVNTEQKAKKKDKVAYENWRKQNGIEKHLSEGWMDEFAP